MKKLIISLKTSTDVMRDFKSKLKTAKKRKHCKNAHYEISFDNKNDFNRFVRNLDLLSVIIQFKPKSVYELAKLCDKDVSNVNKVITFFDDMGVITLKKTRVSGREVKTPIVEYDKVEFSLAA
jgi:predicted transcriptional regulator